MITMMIPSLIVRLISIFSLLIALLLLDNVFLENNNNHTDTSVPRSVTDKLTGTSNQHQLNKQNESVTPADDSSVFHVCQQNHITFSDSSRLKILYQCEGPAYDSFTQHMWRYVHNNESDSFSLWGRRSFPLPAHASVLAMGNSHTRQAMAAIPCQYNNLVQSTTMHGQGEFMHSYHFDNNSTLTIVFNTPLLYSRKWPWLLEQALHRALSSYDAIVFGEFNSIAKAQPTNFYRRTMAYFEQQNMNDTDHNKHHYDLLQPDNPHGPNVPQVANWTLRQHQQLDHQTPSSPILALTSFDAHRQVRLQTSAQRQQARETKTHGKTRTIDLWNGRHYVELLQHECGSDFKTTLPQLACFTPATHNRSSAMHRCTGRYGGHADLIAWDVIEWIHQRVGRVVGPS